MVARSILAISNRHLSSSMWITWWRASLACQTGWSMQKTLEGIWQWRPAIFWNRLDFPGSYNHFPQTAARRHAWRLVSIHIWSSPTLLPPGALSHPFNSVPAIILYLPSINMRLKSIMLCVILDYSQSFKSNIIAHFSQAIFVLISHILFTNAQNNQK